MSERLTPEITDDILDTIRALFEVYLDRQMGERGYAEDDCVSSLVVLGWDDKHAEEAVSQALTNYEI